METSVPGLLLYRDFISSSLEEELIAEIDAQPWVVDYDRRLQYYGYRNELEKPYHLVEFPVPIPPAIYSLSHKIVEQNILQFQPDSNRGRKYRNITGTGLIRS